MCSVDAVRPHVGAVAGHDSRGVIVPKAEHFVGAVAGPVSTSGGSPQRRIGIIPSFMCTHADGMPHLVHDGTGALITCVGAYAHPSAVTAVGGGRLCSVVYVEIQSFDAGQVVPIVHSRTYGCIDTFIGIRRPPVVVSPSDGTLGDGDDLDVVAIAHSVVFGDGVCPHVIYSGWRQVAYDIDAAVVVQVFGCAVVFDGGFGIGAPTKTLFLKLGGRHSGHCAPSEGHSGTTGITCVGHYGRDSTVIACL